MQPSMLYRSASHGCLLMLDNETIAKDSRFDFKTEDWKSGAEITSILTSADTSARPCRPTYCGSWQNCC